MAAGIGTRDYQRNQVALRAVVYSDVTVLWRLLDMDRLDETFPVFAASVLHLIEARRPTSVHLARDYLAARRVGVPGVAPDIDAPPLDRAEALVALRITSVISVKTAMTRRTPLDLASRNALVRTMGAVDKFVGDGGRELIRASVDADPAARGWVRVTLGTCDFCAEQAAGDHMQAGDANFPRHDHCGCQPEPVYADALQPEPKFVDKVADLLRGDETSATEDQLRAMLDDPATNPLTKVNIQAGLDRVAAERAELLASRMSGTVAERVPLPDGLVDLFKPRKWSSFSRDKMEADLQRTPEGERLWKLITKFQSISSRSIPLLRTDIEKYLAGDVLAAGRAKDIETLLSAMGRYEVTEVKTLHRGMVIPGNIDSLLAKYQVGDDIDMTLGSFTSDRYVAERFANGSTYGQAVRSTRRTAVRIEWAGEGKRALPLHNTAFNAVIAGEKEYIANGKFVIEQVRRSGDMVVIRVRQVKSL